MKYDLVIENTAIIDGSGAPAFAGKVAARDGKLYILPEEGDVDAVRKIDAKGQYTCPGFIDPHSHGDVPLGAEYASLSKISQGITTHVAGMCGFSMFPVNPENLGLLQESLGLLGNAFPEEMDTFTSCENFLRYSDTVKRPENTMFLIGHVTLRVAVMGYADRVPEKAELEQMKGLLREAMEHGAAGLSSGLVYVPSAYAQEEELAELCKVVAEYGGIYTTHMRDEAAKSIQSLKEAISVAKKTGVRLIISHHKIQGHQNWGMSKQTLELIHQAIAEGVRISCDQYPYTASMTHLSVCAPPKYFTNGLSGMLEYLKDPKMREEIKREMNDPATPYDNFYLHAGGWEGVLISCAPQYPEAEGKLVSEVAKEKGQDPFDTFCDIMIANHGVVTAIYFTMSEEDVFRIIQDENVVVGTDGIIKSMDDKAHPRAFGSFPRAIRYFVRENHLMPLEAMIRKMTSLTAEKNGIPNKGLIRDGYDADLVIFDYETITDRADYIHSNVTADGIDYVIVGGQIVYHDKKLTGATPGKSIRFQR
ncbi:MAG: D-aminoacylase [Anaerotignum sp.]|nr:D-aminoacylase [Anaerotignum sp.]